MLPSILFALSFLVPLSLALVPPRRDPLHVPVTRRHRAKRSGEADIAHHVAVSAGLRRKYGFDSPGASRRGQTSDIGITNQGQDVSYFAQVSVGTPAQSFNLVLDTGSSDLWFATTGCATCPSGTPEFNPSTSTSLQTGSNRISLKYGSGSADGIISEDTVTMGPFTVNQQIFVAVTDVTSGLIDGELAGIMGLAFQGIAASTALPFWQALVNDNLFTSPEFSFFITRFGNDPSAQQEEPGGVLTLGGTNATLYQGDIDFRSFTSPTNEGSFWLQTVTGVIVNGQNVNVPGGDLALAAIDTGTTLIGAPTAAVNAIWAAVPGAEPLSGNLSGSFSFPCNSKLSVAISFGGPSWPISLADLNAGTVGNGGQCLGAIFDITQGSDITPGSGDPAWIIGDTFLKNVYSVFRANPPAVGFAQLSDAAGGSSGTPLPGSSPATITGGSVPTPSGVGGGGNSSAYRTAPVSAVHILVTSALALLAAAFILIA